MLALAASLLTLGAAAVLWMFSRYQNVDKYLEHIALVADLYDQYEAQFKADRKLVESVQVFRSYEDESDAGPFLNSRIEWEVGRTWGTHRILESEVAPKEQIRSNQQLNEWLGEWKGVEWMRHLEELAESDANTDWMTSLHAFDHWEINRNSPAETQVRKAIITSEFEYASPRWESLIMLARVRLARGYQTGDVAGAIADTRQLAHLMYSTESYGALDAVLSYLDDESVFIHVMVDVESLPADAWTAFGSTERKQINRYFDVVTSSFLPYVPAHMIKGLNDRNAPGVCTGISLWLQMSANWRQYLEPRFPFELDLRANYAAMDDVVAQTEGKCRLLWLRTQWRAMAADPFIATWPYSDSSLDDLFALWVNRIPYLRRYTFIGEDRFLPFDELEAYE